MNNKAQGWDGSRPHPPGQEGGRPSMGHGRKNLVLDCSEGEYQLIINSLSTRERAEILLKAVNEDGGNKSG